MTLIRELEEIMGKSKMPAELARAIRALTRLSTSILDLEAVGIQMQLKQQTRWVTQNGPEVHKGFEVTLRGPFVEVVNIQVAEPGA